MNDKKPFYEILKSQRQSKNIDIQEICDSTKISEKYISAIESGTFDVLPNVYMRLFLISYCKYIGIDYKKTIHEYENHTQTESQSINIESDKTITQNSNNLKDQESIESNLSNYLNPSSYFLSPLNIFKALISIVILYILYLIAAQAINNNNSIDISQKLDDKKTSNLIIDSSYKEKTSSFEKKNAENLIIKNKSNFIRKSKSSTIPNQEAFNSAQLIKSSTLSNKNLNISSQKNAILPFLFTVLPKENSFMYVGIDGRKISQVELLKGQEQSLEFDSLIQFDMIGATVKKIFINIHDVSSSTNNHQDLIRGSYDIFSEKLFISLYK